MIEAGGVAPCDRIKTLMRPIPTQISVNTAMPTSFLLSYNYLPSSQFFALVVYVYIKIDSRKVVRLWRQVVSVTATELVNSCQFWMENASPQRYLILTVILHTKYVNMFAKSGGPTHHSAMSFLSCYMTLVYFVTLVDSNFAGAVAASVIFGHSC